MSDLWLLGAGVLAAVALYRAARRDDARNRHPRAAWAVLAVAQLARVLGDLVSLLSEAGTTQRTSPWQLDLTYLFADALFVYGLLLTRRPSSTLNERARTLLDIGICSLGAILVSWHFLVLPLVAGDSATNWSIAIAIGYGAMYSVMVFVSLELVFDRRTSMDRIAILLLVAGALTKILAGIIALPICPPLGACRAGDWDSVFWLLSYALVGLAGWRQLETRPEVPEPGNASPGRGETKSIWTLYFPYVAVIVAYVLLALDRGRTDLATNAILIYSTGAIIGLVIVRQIFVVNENVRLYWSSQAEIAVRRRAEEDLRQARDHLEKRVDERTAELVRERNLLRTLIDNLPDAIYIKDLRDRFLVSNAAHAALYAKRPSQVIGKTAAEILPPESVGLSAENDERVLQAGESFLNCEEPKPGDPPGRKGWMLTTKVPFLDGLGKVVGLVGIARDITERKRAEENLRESETRLRALVGSIDEIVFELDEEGTYLNIWTSNESLLARRRSELLGHPAEQVLGEEAARPMLDACRRVLQTGQPETIEYPLDVQTGRRWFSAHLSPIPASNRGGKTVAMLVRDITENKSAEEALVRRTRIMETLYETSLEINSHHDVPSLLGAIVKRAAGLLDVRMGGFYLMRPDGESLELIVRYNIPDTYGGTILRLDEGLSGRIAATGEAMMVADYRQWQGRADPYIGAPFRRTLGVPLKWREKIIGVLTLTDGERTGAFTEDEMRLARLFADQATLAIENTRLFEETKRRAERLALLNRIGRAVSTTLKLDDLLEIVYREMANVTNADAFFVALYDPSTTEFDFRIRVDAGIREPVERLSLRSGLTSYVVENKKPLLIQDLEREKEGLPIASMWGTMRQPQSWLGVPMLLGDKLVGVISVQAYRIGAFSIADQELLSTIADTVVVAVENARLFEETNRRAEQLTTLREIDRTLSSILDLGPMLDTMLSRLEQIVPYESGVVLLLDGSRLRSVAARGRMQPSWSGYTLDISNNPIFKQMSETGAPILIDDLSKQPDWVSAPGVENTCTWLGVPLIARGEVIGQIGLFSAEPGKITKEHSDLVMAFANHAAIAIANARLHAELQEQARRDSLTQVLNHGTFISELRAAHARGEPLALIMLDLDDFKRYNDTHGHVVGDAALTAMVQSIQAHVKSGDIVGRWGGDEFGVALRGTDVVEAVKVAERIRSTLAGMQILDRQNHLIPALTASQGIAAMPESAHDVDELIERADGALYRAKQRGRDQVVLAD